MIRPTLDYTEIGTSGISTKKIPEQSVVTLTEMMMMMTREGIRGGGTRATPKAPKGPKKLFSIVCSAPPFL